MLPWPARRGVSNLSESMHGALAALVGGKSRRGLAVIGVHRMVMTLVAVDARIGRAARLAGSAS
jgi:hypothetical protein